MPPTSIQPDSELLTKTPEEFDTLLKQIKEQAEASLHDLERSIEPVVRNFQHDISGYVASIEDEIETFKIRMQDPVDIEGAEESEYKAVNLLEKFTERLEYWNELIMKLDHT